jgi:hypothetical protein
MTLAGVRYGSISDRRSAATRHMRIARSGLKAAPCSVVRNIGAPKVTRLRTGKSTND